MRFTKSEMQTKPVPKQESDRHRDNAKQPEHPDRSAVPYHFASVANAIERTSSDVGSVGNQAKASKEPRHVRTRKPGKAKYAPQQQRQQNTQNGTSPHNHERLRI